MTHAMAIQFDRLMCEDFGGAGVKVTVQGTHDTEAVLLGVAQAEQLLAWLSVRVGRPLMALPPNTRSFVAELLERGELTRDEQVTAANILQALDGTGDGSKRPNRALRRGYHCNKHRRKNGNPV